VQGLISFFKEYRDTGYLKGSKRNWSTGKHHVCRAWNFLGRSWNILRNLLPEACKRDNARNARREITARSWFKKDNASQKTTNPGVHVPPKKI
jgi:hypothetical protein